jgi:hypothetical protein
VDPYAPAELAAPPNGQRHRVVALALLGLVGAVAALVPVVTAATVLVGMALLRVADAAALAQIDRRFRRGRRPWDLARVLGCLPWHATRGALATLWHLPVPLLVGGLVGASAGLVAEVARPGRGWTVAAVGALVGGVLTSWVGGRGAPLRRASSWVLDRVVPSRAAAALVFTVLVAAAGLAVAGAAETSASWWPAESPL